MEHRLKFKDSIFVEGVAFKKTFSYAGFEQQPKKFTNPKIICLNIELELKNEKENAEIKIEDPTVSHHAHFPSPSKITIPFLFVLKFLWLISIAISSYCRC